MTADLDKSEHVILQVCVTDLPIPRVYFEQLAVAISQKQKGWLSELEPATIGYGRY